MDISPTSSLLLCHENVTTTTNLDNQHDEFSSMINDNEDDDYDDYIQMLLDREMITTCHQFDSVDTDWILRARLDGINYILKKRETLGFRFQTAYLSVTFLDRFLSRRSIDKEKSWAIRLLSIACLSLAAKMDECVVPPLSEFCLDECYNFESNVIQRMELFVLNTLQWRLGSSIAPFAFVSFFAKKFGENSSLSVNGLSSIVRLIIVAMRDVKIMCRRPSVIAAAATLVVLDRRSTNDALQLKIASLSCALEIEDVINCYNQVKELEMQSVNIEQGIIKTPDVSPIIQSQRTEAGISVDSSNTKRKRLIFDHLGDADDISDNKKQKN